MPSWKKIIVSGSNISQLNNDSGYATTGSNIFKGNQTVNGNLTVTGSITALQYIVSSSVMYVTESNFSGSHVFGNSLDDTHQFTGSVYITGSSYLIGDSTITGSMYMQSGSIVMTGPTASITGVDYIDFDNQYTIGTNEPAWKEGRLFYDSGSGGLAFYNWERDVTLNIGQEQWLRARNQTGVTITNGSVVKLSSAIGDRPTIVLAQAIDQTNTFSVDNDIIGMATHDIETGTDGFVTTFGLVNGVNTNAFNAGDLLWVSQSAGQYTNVPPSPPYDKLFVGIVTRKNANNGTIFVTPQTSLHFHDISSVSASLYTQGDIWMYKITGSSGIWTNTKTLSGSYVLSGSLTTNDGISVQTVTASFVSASSITGSLFGTSSWATNTLTASYNPNSLITASVSLNTITFTKGNGSTFPITIDTGSGGGAIGPGVTNTLALWNSTSTITDSNILRIVADPAAAIVENNLYKVGEDGLKITGNGGSTITSSINSNVFVDNISPASNHVLIEPNSYQVIKYLDLYKFNVTDRSGCYGLILDFNLILDAGALRGNPDEFTYNKATWPDTSNTVYYAETGRIYLSWLGADRTTGGVIGKNNTVTYLTMNTTIDSALVAGWDQVDNSTFPSATALAASEEGVAAPYNAPLYRDSQNGYQFGYKLVNLGVNWYVEVALFNSTSTKLRITHVAKPLTIFTNP